MSVLNLRKYVTHKKYRRQIDITTYQIRKIKADTSLCLFGDDMVEFYNTILEYFVNFAVV